MCHGSPLEVVWGLVEASSAVFGVQGGVMDAYLRLSEALLAGLNQLSLEADKAPGHVRAGKDVSAACFEVPSAYEITVDGRKLMGSAQSRRMGYVLQHGTLPLVGDVTRLIELLTLSEEEAQKLRGQLGKRACTLAQALGVQEDDPQIQFAIPGFDHIFSSF